MAVIRPAQEDSTNGKPALGNEKGRITVKAAIAFILMLSLLTIAGGQAYGQELIVFPAKGQSQQQMERDKFDCYSWAKQQSGFDPMQTQAPTQPSPSQPPPGASPGSVVRGGAGGAALGAAVGGIAGGWSGAGKERPSAPSPEAFSVV